MVSEGYGRRADIQKNPSKLGASATAATAPACDQTGKDARPSCRAIEARRRACATPIAARTIGKDIRTIVNSITSLLSISNFSGGFDIRDGPRRPQTNVDWSAIDAMTPAIATVTSQAAIAPTKACLVQRIARRAPVPAGGVIVLREGA